MRARVTIRPSTGQQQILIGELSFEKDFGFTFVTQSGTKELRQPIFKKLDSSHFVFVGASTGFSGTLSAWIDAEWAIEYVENEEVAAFDQNMWKFAGALS